MIKALTQQNREAKKNIEKIPGMELKLDNFGKSIESLQSAIMDIKNGLGQMNNKQTKPRKPRNKPQTQVEPIDDQPQITKKTEKLDQATNQFTENHDPQEISTNLRQSTIPAQNPPANPSIQQAQKRKQSQESSTNSGVSKYLRLDIEYKPYKSDSN